MKYERWGNLTYEDIWRQCKADIKNGKQDFKLKDINDWRPASSMHTNLPIDLIPNALVLYLNDYRKFIYIYKTMVFEIKK